MSAITADEKIAAAKLARKTHKLHIHWKPEVQI